MSALRALRALTAGTVVAATACTALLVGSDDADSPASLFDVLWHDFDRYYASFGIRSVNWDSLRQVYRPLAEAATTDAELAAVFQPILETLRDPHVDLWDEDDMIAWSQDRSRIVTRFDLSMVRTYLTTLRTSNNGRLMYGRHAANLAYLHLPSFSGTNWTDQVDDVIAFFGPAAGVIVDLRDNGGGTSVAADAIASRFMDQRREFAFIRFRNGPGHGDFSAPEPIAVAPGGSRQFSRPLVLLTNRKTTSAAERFALAMRVRPGAIAIGDTTSGAFSTPLVRELPNGWTYRLPHSIAYDVLHVTHEGIGLVPDVVVPFTANDVTRGRDPQLEAAIAYLQANALRGRQK